LLGRKPVSEVALNPNNPAQPTQDAREIPNYWTNAHEFVLQERMLSPIIAELLEELTDSR